MKKIGVLLVFIFCTVSSYAQLWNRWLVNYSFSHEVLGFTYSATEKLRVTNDAVPKGWDNPLEIKVLKVSQCKKFPQQLITLKNLEVLDISFCEFKVSTIPFDKFPKLKVVNLFHCLIPIMNIHNVRIGSKDDVLPQSITTLSELEYLRLYDNAIVDIPADFGNLINLKQLQIASQPFLKLPDSFSNLRKLEVVEFYFFDPNRQKDVDFNPKFFDLVQLKSLHIVSCFSEGQRLGDFKWENLVVLEELEVYPIQDGSLLPDKIFNLKSLKTLHYVKSVLSKDNKNLFKKKAPHVKLKKYN